MEAPLSVPNSDAWTGDQTRWNALLKAAEIAATELELEKHKENVQKQNQPSSLPVEPVLLINYGGSSLSRDKGIDNGRPDLPKAFRDEIERLNGRHVKLVVQKKLEASDLTIHHLRFSIPIKQIIEPDFLSTEEAEILSHKSFKGIPCSLIQPCVQVQRDLKFKRWKNGKTFTYALATNWKAVLENKDNQLQAGLMVQLWSFRVGFDLWFAMVKL